MNELNRKNKLSIPSYIEDVFSRLETGLQTTLDKEMIMTGAEKRKLLEPATEVNNVARGKWTDSAFIFDDNYIPQNFNFSMKNMAQIKKMLQETYNISFDGIPFMDGIADFRGIAVANISIADVVARATSMSNEEYNALSQQTKANVLRKVFGPSPEGKSKREHNFDLADQIVAERHICIPGLPKEYTATQLKKWRHTNYFSWDEQLITGYSLIPSVIHGNLPHTGLVSTSKNAYSFLNWHSNNVRQHPEQYSWCEDDAPIFTGDIEVIKRLKPQKKGGDNMAMRRVLSRGMNLGRHMEIGYDEIHNETGEQVNEGIRLHQLGEKFESDKEKLENQIEKVKAAKISDSDKAKIIAQLNTAIEKLQEQYEKDVANEEAKVQKEIQGQIEQMDEAIDELDQQTNSLREVVMEAASTDTSAAIDAAETKKKEFEQMKLDYTEKLRLQMEQTEIQQRSIRARRLSEK